MYLSTVKSHIMQRENKTSQRTQGIDEEIVLRLVDISGRINQTEVRLEQRSTNTKSTLFSWDGLFWRARIIA